MKHVEAQKIQNTHKDTYIYTDVRVTNAIVMKLNYFNNR
jgi:hypothetical protein